METISIVLESFFSMPDKGFEKYIIIKIPETTAVIDLRKKAAFIVIPSSLPRRYNHSLILQQRYALIIAIQLGITLHLNTVMYKISDVKWVITGYKLPTVIKSNLK